MKYVVLFVLVWSTITCLTMWGTMIVATLCLNRLADRERRNPLYETLNIATGCHTLEIPEALEFKEPPAANFTGRITGRHKWQTRERLLLRLGKVLK